MEVGDKVQVREDITMEMEGESSFMTKEMIAVAGKKATIVKLDCDGDAELDILRGYSFWDDLLILLTDEEEEEEEAEFDEEYDKSMIGKRVKIKADCEYTHQNAGEGTIVKYSGEGWYFVRFEDGYTNDYKIERDLDLLN